MHVTLEKACSEQAKNELGVGVPRLLPLRIREKGVGHVDEECIGLIDCNPVAFCRMERKYHWHFHKS